MDGNYNKMETQYYLEQVKIRPLMDGNSILYFVEYQ